MEPVYATVIKKSKRVNRETPDTNTMLIKEEHRPDGQAQDPRVQLVRPPQAVRPTPLRPPEERTPSPDALDLSAIEDEALLSASEVVGLESDEGRNQGAILH